MIPLNMAHMILCMRYTDMERPEPFMALLVCKSADIPPKPHIMAASMQPVLAEKAAPALPSRLTPVVISSKPDIIMEK